MNSFHQSVLIKETIDYLKPTAGCKYIDATIGGAGHTEELLKNGAYVLGIDRDPEAIEHVKSKHLKNLILVNDNFSHIENLAHTFNFTSLCGILLDLGVSSHQLNESKRGFSFTHDGPLDMRMNPNEGINAYDLINNFDTRRLNEIFKTYGQEKFSLSISQAIESARKVKPIASTGELAQIIEEVYAKGRQKSKIHPATRVFMALRIVVNSEILNLEETLPQTSGLLKKGGRLAVISFHSLEDTKVKRFFKESKLQMLTKRPIRPSPEELVNNPRSRSARLRVAEKI